MRVDQKIKGVFSFDKVSLVVQGSMIILMAIIYLVLGIGDSIDIYKVRSEKNGPVFASV